VAVLAIGILSKGSLAGHEDELKAIEGLAAFRYPEQSDKAKPGCTDKGYKLVETLEGFLPASFNPVSVKTNPQFCEVEMARDSAEGKSRIHVRLVKDNGWKFDDVYLNEINGKPCNQWASYACEHPLASFLQFHSGEILEFCKAACTLADDVLDVVQKFKQLDAEEKAERDGTPAEEYGFRSLTRIISEHFGQPTKVPALSQP